MLPLVSLGPISNRKELEVAAGKSAKGSSAAEERLRKAQQHERATAELQASVRSSQMELSVKQDALCAAEARIADRERAVEALEEKLRVTQSLTSSLETTARPKPNIQGGGNGQDTASCSVAVGANGAVDAQTRERELEEWSKALGEQAAAMREQALRLEAAFEQLREREASTMQDAHSRGGAALESPSRVREGSELEKLGEQEAKTDSEEKQQLSMMASAAASYTVPAYITARVNPGVSREMNEAEVSRQLEQETVRLAEKARELDAERRRLAIAAETAEREQSRAQKERQEAFEARKEAAKLRVELERERARLEAEKGGLAAEKSLLAAERGRLATDRARAVRREGRVVGFSGVQGGDNTVVATGEGGQNSQSRPPHTAVEPLTIPQLGVREENRVESGATRLGNGRNTKRSERQSYNEGEGTSENVTGRVAPYHPAEDIASPSQRQATTISGGDVATVDVAGAHGQSTVDDVQPAVLGSAVKSRQINPVTAPPPRAETSVLTQKSGDGMEAEENSSNELHGREEGTRSIKRANQKLSKGGITTRRSETEDLRASQPTVESVRRRLHRRRDSQDEGGSETSEDSSLDSRGKSQPGVASTGTVNNSNMSAFRPDQKRSRRVDSSTPLSNQGGAGSLRVSRSSAAAAAAAIASREDPFLAQLHARLAGADYTFRKSLGRREALLSKFGPAGGSIGPSEGDTSDFPSGSVDVSPETKASDSSSPGSKGLEHQRNTAGSGFFTTGNEHSRAGDPIDATTDKFTERSRFGFTGRSMMPVRASGPQRGGRRQSSLVAAVVPEESLEAELGTPGKSSQTPVGDSRVQQSEHSSAKETCLHTPASAPAVDRPLNGKSRSRKGALRVEAVVASAASDTDDTEAEKENLRELMRALGADGEGDASEGSLHMREEASVSSISGGAFTTPVQQPRVLDERQLGDERDESIEESKGSGDESIEVTTGEADAGGGNTLMSLRAQNEIVVSRLQDMSLQVGVSSDRKIFVACSDRGEWFDRYPVIGSCRVPAVEHRGH